MFYRDPPPFFITAVTGYVRPDIHATRRNAYQRMFGMDLNHGTDDNKPYPYVKAEAANKRVCLHLRRVPPRGLDRHGERQQHKRRKSQG